MVNYDAEYKRKLISADEAAGLVKSGSWIDYGAICGFPTLIDERLAARAGELTGVKIRAEHSHTQIPRLDPAQESFVHNSWFLGKLERQYADAGACSYIPFNLSEGPRMYRQWLRDEVDITFIEVAPMDGGGNFSFGAAITRQKAACEAAKTVVVEVNPHQPRVFGAYDDSVHVSEVDYIVENHVYKIPEFPVPEITETDRLMAGHLAAYISDGATIQLGVGATPGCVGSLLIEHGIKDLGIHTEMFTESMMHLIKAGIVTGSRKNLNPGKAVYCFAAGTPRLYDFISENPALLGYPADYTNDPHVIGQNENMVSINSALKVDLKGQVCSESVGARQISGTGGQLDFVRGAYLSQGGRAFICLHSTRQMKDGSVVSNIRPMLEEGDTVTVPSADTFFVVTEYGAVNLKGRSLWERARLLISIAHPGFREGLEKRAADFKDK